MKNLLKKANQKDPSVEVEFGNGPRLIALVFHQFSETVITLCGTLSRLIWTGTELDAQFVVLVCGRTYGHGL